MVAEYPEYSLKFSSDAHEQRSRLPSELLPNLDDIIQGLVSDPKQYPDRLLPASRDGKNFVYMHPEPLIQVTFEIEAEKKVIYVISVAAPAFRTKKTIFMSYSHEDKKWLELLRKFLTVLEQQGIIELWDDRKIEAGADWRGEIQKALDSSKAALLLVSQDFLISDFITKFELPTILADAQHKGMKIFWIPVRESTVFESHKEITKFQSLLEDPNTSLQALSDSDREKALVRISKTLSGIVGRGH